MDLEVLRKSAEMCGYIATNVGPGGAVIIYPNDKRTHWEPFTNAEQRWECVKKLLEMGYDFVLDQRGWHRIWEGPNEPAAFMKDCPAEEFPARALGALKARKASDLAKKESP